ncbi:50S ribosomal protein L17 [Cryptobacterium curtum]|uniref:50S ribosomal protein L17 n=1 Tax=Cryptobacterium curtum TaxID=84163 RepID=UPI0031ECBC27
MRHYKKGRKLGTDASHTKAMKKSLVAALFTNDRIKTIEMRAKEIRPDVDRIITWAKRGDLHSRRLAIRALGDKELVREVFEKVAQGQFADRKGGYTRIMKLGYRKGDNAPMVIVELVTEPVAKKKAEKSSKAASGAKKAAPKTENAKESKAAAATDEAKEEQSAVEEDKAVSEKATTKGASSKAKATKKTDAKESAAEKAVDEAAEGAAEQAALDADDAKVEKAAKEEKVGADKAAKEDAGE